MADRHFWIEVDAEDAKDGLERAYARAFGGARNLVEHLSERAEILLSAEVPIFSTYTHQHIDHDAQASWKPGGLGGGGEWESTAGVRAGSSRHPIYANIGSGIYGKYRRPIESSRVEMTRMGPEPARQYFYSFRYGRVIGVRSVQGQRPQRFLYKAFVQLQAYAATRLMTGP